MVGAFASFVGAVVHITKAQAALSKWANQLQHRPRCRSSSETRAAKSFPIFFALVLAPLCWPIGNASGYELTVKVVQRSR